MCLCIYKYIRQRMNVRKVISTQTHTDTHTHTCTHTLVSTNQNTEGVDEKNLKTTICFENIRILRVIEKGCYFPRPLET